MDPIKQQHNAWIVASAACHQHAILVLDGLDLRTSHDLMRSSVSVERIHIPNRPDYDALIERSSHAPHGHLYRATVLAWVQAYRAVAEPRPKLGTVWLDYCCKWGAHVEQTLIELFSGRTLGAEADLFLTLCHARHGKSIEEVQRMVLALAARLLGEDEALVFREDHSMHYGNGMMILHAKLVGRAAPPVVARAPARPPPMLTIPEEMAGERAAGERAGEMGAMSLHERLRHTHTFRKPLNSKVAQFST